MVEKLDGKEVKQKILRYLEEKGPELPIHIAKHIGMNTLFAGAFLSEMASEGTIQISNMKVGGSPLYFTRAKVAMLENFSKYLNEKEQEALMLLKENKVLKDEEQHPAIRVALRGLKDFAIQLKQEDGRMLWKYFLAEDKTEEPQKNLEPEKMILEKPRAPEQTKIQAQESISELERINKEIEEKRKELELLNQKIPQEKDKIDQEVIIKKLEKPKNKAKKKKIDEKEKFLGEIKEALTKKGFSLINIESYDKKQVFARVSISGTEYLIAAYNKKKVEDSDLIKAYKKSLALNLPYHVISRGDVSKKTREAIEAYKRLAQLDILEKGEKEVQESSPEIKINPEQ